MQVRLPRPELLWDGWEGRGANKVKTATRSTEYCGVHSMVIYRVQPRRGLLLRRLPCCSDLSNFFVIRPSVVVVLGCRVRKTRGRLRPAGLIERVLSVRVDIASLHSMASREKPISHPMLVHIAALRAVLRSSVGREPRRRGNCDFPPLSPTVLPRRALGLYDGPPRAHEAWRRCQVRRGKMKGPRTAARKEHRKKNAKVGNCFRSASVAETAQ